MQLAAEKAMQFFGVSFPQDRMELRKNICLRRYDFYRDAYLHRDRQPNKITSWTWTRFSRPDIYDEYDNVQSMMKDIEKSGIVVSNVR